MYLYSQNLQQSDAVQKVAGRFQRGIQVYIVVALIIGLVFSYEPAAAQISEARKASSAPELVDQIKRGGGTILLAGGEYGILELRGAWQPTNPLILRSVDRSDPPQFSGLKISHAQNIVIQGINFEYSFKSSDGSDFSPFGVYDSNNISIQQSKFKGDVAFGLGDDENGLPSSTGLVVKGSFGVFIEDSVFETFKRGISVSQTTNVTIKDNVLHKLRLDGLSFSEVQRVLIEGNHIYDFEGRLDSNDHRDMIQFWTTGTKSMSGDIVIRDNLLNSGDGIYTQSIFMRNELVDTGMAGQELYYQNVSITNNVIINAHLHGITIGETNGLNIQNNTIVRNFMSEGELDNLDLWTPRIRLSPSSKNVKILRNVTSSIDGPAGQKDWLVSDNLIIQDRQRMKPWFYTTVFSPQSIQSPNDPRSFAPLRGGPLDGTGIGASWAGSSVPRTRH